MVSPVRYSCNSQMTMSNMMIVQLQRNAGCPWCTDSQRCQLGQKNRPSEGTGEKAVLKFHDWMNQRTCKVWLGCRNIPQFLHTHTHTLLPPYSLCLVTVTKLCCSGQGFVSHTNQNKDPITAPPSTLSLPLPPSPLFFNPSVLLSFNAMMSVFPLLSSPCLCPSSHSLAPLGFRGQPRRAIHTSALTTEPDKGSKAVQHRSLVFCRLYGLILTWQQCGVLSVMCIHLQLTLAPMSQHSALTWLETSSSTVEWILDQCCWLWLRPQRETTDTLQLQPEIEQRLFTPQHW